jgi:hypothetical protein
MFVRSCMSNSLNYPIAVIIPCDRAANLNLLKVPMAYAIKILLCDTTTVTRDLSLYSLNQGTDVIKPDFLHSETFAHKSGYIMIFPWGEGASALSSALE